MALPGKDSDLWKIVSSISCAMVAYTFANNLFPIFSSLKVKTNQNMTKTVTYGIFLTGFIYTFLSFVCISLFGYAVDLSTNIMDCINREYSIDSSVWESFVL